MKNNKKTYYPSSIIMSAIYCAAVLIAFPQNIFAYTPSISSITSTANIPGILKEGDQIVFTLTPLDPAPNASISGFYNGNRLNWSTSNGGSTYQAGYSVLSTDSNQSTPLQIINVTLTDSNGNTSNSVSGYDIKETIAAHGATLTTATSVPSIVNTATPSYTFISDEAGTITYLGDCTGQTTSAIVGSNTITFKPLNNGIHNNCYLGVVDLAGNGSTYLSINPFTVQNVTSTTQNAAPNTTLSNETAAKPSGVLTFIHPLSLGSKGNDVTLLQKRLKADGFYSGPITQYFGPLTKVAVKKYQAHFKLTQLGSVGPGTRALLNQGK